jgi:hypothetical protein
VGASENWIFHDLLDGSEYLWKRSDIDRDGLYVRLAPYQAHAFEIHGS